MAKLLTDTLTSYVSLTHIDPNKLPLITDSSDALVFEGLDISSANLTKLIKWIEKHTSFKPNPKIYFVSGREVNMFFLGIGGVLYPEDLHIVLIPLDQLVNPGALITPRILTGGRWLSDILDRYKVPLCYDE